MGERGFSLCEVQLGKCLFDGKVGKRLFHAKERNLEHAQRDAETACVRVDGTSSFSRK